MSEQPKEHPKHPLSDWRYEVANEDTILGYQEWLEHCLEDDEEEREASIEHWRRFGVRL